MNILSLVAYALSIIALLWLCFRLRTWARGVDLEPKLGANANATRQSLGRHSYDNDGVSPRVIRWGSNLALLAALLLVLIFVNNYLYRIPNPIEPRGATFTTPYRAPTNSEPVVLKAPPPSNADPAAAAAHQQELLGAAKQQQTDQLKQ